MGHRIGIIAGSGEFPFLVLVEARKRGYSVAVAGIKGEAQPGLRSKADIFRWVTAGRIQDLISFFKENRVKEAVFAGKVDHRIIFKRGRFDKTALNLLAQTQERSPTAIIKAVIDHFSREGIHVKDPTVFISSTFCPEGILTQTKASPKVKEDIAFGWTIARHLADLDIGQTVIVKDKAVVAVEGLEGTDEAIQRGGHLAGEEIVVVKVSRPSQDARIDLPAVGLKTVERLCEVKGRALCLQAQKVLFFQREKAAALADAHGISIVAQKS